MQKQLHNPDGQLAERERPSRSSAFEVTENVWIPMPDGCRLAARLWLPEGCGIEPVATIFEFLPYRKRDVTRARDDEVHGYFSAQGYACIRVDMRGSGDSGGFAAPMYARDERLDGVAVIRWIAQQPWSNGKVGMIGLSWGGSISLYCAKEAPPELGAIVCIAGPHDSFSRDILFKGGCLTNEVIGWAATMDGLTSRPPDPAIVGNAWREIWRARLDRLEPEVKAYLDHQRRDWFWRERDLTDQLPIMTVPVLAVGGWADSTVGTNPPDLVAGMSGPRRGLMGPWAHKYPQHGVPGPAIDFLSEAKTWFDEHLCGIAPQTHEPMLRAYMLRDTPVEKFMTEAPGRWVAEDIWPSPRIEPVVMFLNEDGLEWVAVIGAGMPVSTDQTVGLCGGEMMPSFGFGEGEELPGDQSQDDAASLCFDSGPLEADFEILGAPEITLRVSSDKPSAMLAVRLNHLSPEGQSKRISYAVQNLRHRKGDFSPADLTPGETCTLTIRLHDIAYSVPKGHRLRVAISTTYWPLCWPQPDVATVMITPGDSRISLPGRPETPVDAELRPFNAPTGTLMPGRSTVVPAKRHRATVFDPSADTTTLTIVDDGGVYRVDDTGSEISSKAIETSSISKGDPLSARMTIGWEWSLSRGDWQVEVRTGTKIWCDAEYFYVRSRLDAREGGKSIHSATRDMRFFRDNM